MNKKYALQTHRETLSRVLYVKAEGKQMKVVDDRRPSNCSQTHIMASINPFTRKRKFIDHLFSPPKQFLQTEDRNQVIIRKKLSITPEDLIYGRKEARNELIQEWSTYAPTELSLLDVKIDIRNTTILDELGLSDKTKMVDFVTDETRAKERIGERIEGNRVRIGDIDKLILQQQEKISELTDKISLFERFSPSSALIQGMKDEKINLTQQITNLENERAYRLTQNNYLSNGNRVIQHIRHIIESLGSKDLTADTEITRLCKYGLSLNLDIGKIKFLLNKYSYEQLKGVPEKRADSITDHEMRAAYRLSLKDPAKTPEFYIRKSYLNTLLTEPADRTHVLYPTSQTITDVNAIVQVRPPWEWGGELGNAWATYIPKEISSTTSASK